MASKAATNDSELMDELEEAIKSETNRSQFEKDLRAKFVDLINMKQKRSKDEEKWLNGFNTFIKSHSNMDDVDEQLMKTCRTIKANLKQSHRDEEQFIEDLKRFKQLLWKRETDPLNELVDLARAPLMKTIEESDSLRKHEREIQKKIETLNAKIESHSPKSSEWEKHKAERKRLRNQLKEIQGEAGSVKEEYEKQKQEAEERFAELLEESADKEENRLNVINDVLQEFQASLPTKSPRTTNPKAKKKAKKIASSSPDTPDNA